MNLNEIRAVIFDFDGVILESADIKTQAFMQLFAEYPEHRDAILDYHLTHLGISRFDKFAWVYRELLHQPFTESERARLGQQFTALAFESVLKCPFVPGVQELLNALYGKTLLFVASGTPQEELDMILERRDLARFFRGAWGAPAKKPYIIGNVLNEYGLTPDRALMIGDGTTDYDAARETGVHFIARVTPELSETWEALGVKQIQDLTGLL